MLVEAVKCLIKMYKMYMQGFFFVEMINISRVSFKPICESSLKVSLTACELFSVCSSLTRVDELFASCAKTRTKNLRMHREFVSKGLKCKAGHASFIQEVAPLAEGCWPNWTMTSKHNRSRSIHFSTPLTH